MNKLRGFQFVSALMIAVLAFGVLGAPPVKAQEGSTLLDVALAANAETGEFSILIAALQAANPNIIERLSSEQGYTVFAPTDAAFTAMLDDLDLTAEELLSDTTLVSRILRYHIAPDTLDSTEVLAMESIRTLQNRFFQENGVLMDVNDREANIVTADIEASNGVIHVIDRVLLPELRNNLVIGDTILDVAMAANDETGEFSILIAALQAANPNLIDRLDSNREYTVFAPTDAAFTAMLDDLGLTAEELLSDTTLVSRILRYHIAPDTLDSTEVLAMESIRTLQNRFFQENGVLMDVNDREANIVTADIEASNGVIHVIDRVLLPELRNNLVIGDTILDVVLANNDETGEFSILVAALEAANPNILQRLESNREYTVFAPTDAAFAAFLDEAGITAEQLLSDQDLVSRVLRYHIIRDELDSTEVLASERLETLQDGPLFQNGGVLTDVNNRTANIVTTDIQAGNGVIHVIDRVLLPETRQIQTGETIIDVAMAANEETGEFSILLAALEVADPNLFERLDSRGEHTVFAPTDAAFAALLDELGLTAEQVLSNQALVSMVLRHHIVQDELDSTEVLARESINTLRGRLSQANGVLTDASGRTANIVTTDIQANNGIIHVIDRVLLPR